MLLAFDTATAQVSVAVHDGERVLAEVTATESMRHGENLAPSIQQVLERAGVAVRDLTAVAVGAGPGPFTGLRVGLVTARTLGFALDVPVHGVCSLDVLAAEALDAGLAEFVVATDARRREVYVARYDGTTRFTGPDVQQPTDAATALPVIGRGAVLYPEAFPDAHGPEHPSAAVLCDVVVHRRFEIGAPEPLYLRRPDAREPGRRKPVSPVPAGGGSAALGR